MEIKVSELKRLVDALGGIKETKMKSRTAYKIAMLSHEAEKNFSFYRDRVLQIYEENVEKTEDGNFAIVGDQITFKEGKEESFFEEMAELDELKVEFSNRTFTLEELDDFSIDPVTISALLPFIEE